MRISDWSSDVCSSDLGVAQVWAAVLAVVAVLFFILAKDDPEYAPRKAGGIPARTLKDPLEPLTNAQVWRFSLYYFFVFGAFVALALRSDDRRVGTECVSTLR